MLICIEDQTAGRTTSMEVGDDEIERLIVAYRDHPEPPTEAEVIDAASSICGCLWQRGGAITEHELEDAIWAALFYLLNSYPPVYFGTNTASVAMVVQYDETGSCIMCAGAFSVNVSAEEVH